MNKNNFTFWLILDWCLNLGLSISLSERISKKEITRCLQCCHHDKAIARGHSVHLMNGDSAKQLSTFGPSQSTCAVVLPVGCYHPHPLTHSLVDLPRWGLATSDNHSDIFLLHCARSCDISFSWMYSQPVHSSTSSIHCLLGLPWYCNPSMIPSRTVSANCPALPQVIWQKYCSFSFVHIHHH